MQLNPGPTTERFFHPRNVGDVEQPAFTGRATSFTCGAAIRISLRVDESQRIIEAKFKAAGCSALVASASLLTDEVVGKTTGEAAAEVAAQAAALARQLAGGEQLPRELGQDTADCAVLAGKALLSAIAGYSDSIRDEWHGEEALICTCFGVSERTIESEIEKHQLHSIAEVTRACNAGGGCRSCYPLIEDILETANR